MPRPSICEVWELTDPTTEQKSDAVVSRAASVKLDAVTDQLFGDEADNALTVGAAASRLGITVRTLHHWDAIGLVCPSGRSDGGYRLYTDADLGRIGRVLVYRDVGLSLDEIGILLESPAAHVDETLRGQRAELRQRIADLEQRGESLDRIIDARKSGVLLPADEQVSIFGRHWQPSWGPEAHERWGDSAQWAQHAERSAGRTAEDWQKIADCVEALNEDLALACRAGVEPGSAEANSLAERHRASIGVYFDCTHSMQVCLGRMYVADPGFSEFYDALFYETVEAGLTAWLRAVIDANALAHGVVPESATWV